MCPSAPDAQGAAIDPDRGLDTISPRLHGIELGDLAADSGSRRRCHPHEERPQMKARSALSVSSLAVSALAMLDAFTGPDFRRAGIRLRSRV